MYVKVFNLGLIFMFLLGSAGSFSGQSPPQPEINLQDTEYIEDQILVSFKPNIGRQRADAVLAEHGLERVRQIQQIRLEVLQLPKGLSVEKALEIFSKRPEVAYAEPNYLISIASSLQASITDQWGLQKINAPQAWENIPAENRTPIIIAVVDTGIDPNHLDLDGNVWSNEKEIPEDGQDNDNNGYIDDTWGWDFVNNDNSPLDDNFHGTAVSSVAAGNMDGPGVTGVCPWCQILPVKVISAEGTGSLDVAASGIIYAADNHAKIINLSLAAGFGMPTLENAVNYAWNKGSLVVAAAGNDGSNTTVFPAGYANAMSVGSTDINDGYSCFSNFSAGFVDVAAPGSNILFAYLPGGTASGSGTSLATPHVVGLAGLLINLYPTFTNQQLRNTIENTTIDLGPDGPDAFFGTGRIDALRAISLDTSPTTSPHQDFVLSTDATAYAHARKLARSADGTLHLVWYEKENGLYKIQYAYSNDDATSWSPRQTIFSSPAETYHPAIAVDNETLYVVFPTLSGASKYQIKFSKKPISGGSWEEAVSLMGGGYDAVRPDIYLDPSNNRLHVVASSFDNANFAYYRNTSDGGQTWSAVTNVDFIYKTRYASVYAYGEKVYIASRTTDAFFIGPSYYLSMMRSFDGGVTWKDRLLMDPQNTDHLNWYSSEYGISMTGFEDTIYLLSEYDGQIRFRRNINWVNWDQVIVYSAGGKWPTITAAPDGTTWMSYLGENGNILVRSYLGGNFYDSASYTSTQVLPLGNYPNFKEGTNYGRAEWVSTSCNGAPFSIGYDWRTVSANTPPQAFFDSPATGQAGTPIAFDAAASYDPDGDPLTYVWDFGDASFANGLSTTHTFNSTGLFNVTLTINDGNGGTQTATAQIVIGDAQGNNPPSANGESYTTDEDLAINQPAPGLLSNDSDPDGNSMTVSLVSGPANGVLTLDPDGAFIYTPNLDYSGTDSFVYRVSDGKGGTDTATVSITVNPIADAPQAFSDSYTTNEDTSLSVGVPGVLGNDIDVEEDPITAWLVSGPAHGSLILNTDGSFEYTPSENYFGPDSFTYFASDGALNSTNTTVTISVKAVNDSPATLNDEYNTTEDTLLSIGAPGVLSNDKDVDGDIISAALISSTSNGVLTLYGNGSFTYIPNSNFNGTDSFEYSASDSHGGTDTGTVSITVNPVNDPPTAAPDSYSVNEDATLSVAAIGVLANDPDPDGNSLSAVLVTNVSSGTLTFNSDGSFSYTPDADYNGPDSFTYQANDGTADSNAATVTINISPVNDPPTAENDSYATDQDTPLNVPAPGLLGNDSDIDSLALDAQLVTGPANGALTLNPDGSFSYLPDAYFVGEDSFAYTANDGAADSSIATVTITVTAVPISSEITANNEILAAGTVVGSYTETWDNNGIYQSIQEKESGGKPANRYSYLEHKWVFSVPSGNAVTLYLNAWNNSSSDGDSFNFAYSTDDQNYTPMFTINSTDIDSQFTFNLDSDTQGQVYVRVQDSDQTSGNRSLDTIYIDHLYLQVVSQAGPPPAAPTGLSASAASYNQINLNWQDNADDESGFYIYRSTDSTNWTLIGTNGTDGTSYADFTVSPDTTYYFQVQSYNTSGSSAFSNPASAITPPLPAGASMHVGNLTSSSSVARSKWNAQVEITVHDQNSNPLENVAVSGAWDEGGTATCLTNLEGVCSVSKNNLKPNLGSVLFTVTNLDLSGYTYNPGANSVTSIFVLSPY